MSSPSTAEPEAAGGRPLRLAFLGCGSVTAKHCGTIRKTKRPVEFLFASRDPAKAADYATRFGGTALGSYAAAFADPGVDAVLVATPPDSHLELALGALRGGKHVIVEKPPFFRAADFDTVGAAAAAAGRQAMIAENYFYKPLAVRLREIVRSGSLGEIRFVHLSALKRQKVEGWRGDAAVVGGGALFEGGIHWVNLAANLGLTVEEAHGYRPGAGDAAASGGLERSMVVVLRYAEGAVGTLLHSWEAKSLLFGLRLSKIVGTEGSVTFESNGLVALERGRRTRLHFPGVRDLAGYRAMFEDFIDALRAGREPALTWATARRDLEIVEAAYGAPVPTS